MSKILINTTGSAVEITDAGVTVPGSGSYTIPPQDYSVFAASSDVIRLLADGTLILNDGGEDIATLSAAVDIIKGWFPGEPIREPFFFDFAGTVSGDDPSSVLGYTVPLDENNFLSRLEVSCRVEAVVQLILDGLSIGATRTGAAKPDGVIQFPFSREALPGQLVQVIVTKRSGTPDVDVEAHLMGEKAAI